jgi:hypothetical protein
MPALEKVTVATFSKCEHAEPLRKRLTEAGYPAEVVHDESALGKLWFVRRPLAGIRLKVHPHDYERALKLLREWDASDDALRYALRCPECGSSRVEYPQLTRRFFLPNLIGLLAALGVVEREFYCQDCHFTWPREGRKHSRIRPHSAPYYFIEGLPQARSDPGPEQKHA